MMWKLFKRTIRHHLAKGDVQTSCGCWTSGQRHSRNWLKVTCPMCLGWLNFRMEEKRREIQNAKDGETGRVSNDLMTVLDGLMGSDQIGGKNDPHSRTPESAR